MYTIHRAVRWMLPAAALALAPSPAPAQAAALQPGDVVRVSTATGREVATVLRATDSVLVLAARAGIETRQIALASVRGVDVSRGRASAGRGLVRGAGIGLLVGAAAGGLLGAATYEEPDRSHCTPTWEELFCGFTFAPQSREENALLGAAAGGMLGLVLGGVGGALKPGTRWERVRLPGHPALAAAAGGVAVRVTLPH